MFCSYPLFFHVLLQRSFLSRMFIWILIFSSESTGLSGRKPMSDFLSKEESSGFLPEMPLLKT